MIQYYAKSVHFIVLGFNLEKTGIGEVMAIFWTINDPPGLQGF